MNQLQFAKQLRSNQTEAESKLWYYLRRKQLNGLKFRRQYAVGPYIVDFVNLKIGLIIEIDGGQHNEEKIVSYDQQRTVFLENCGYKVIRFWDNEIFENINEVLEVILRNISTSP